MTQPKQNNWLYQGHKILNKLCDPWRILGSILLLFFLSNCAVGPHYQRPKQLIPQTYLAKPLQQTHATAIKLGESQYFVPNKELTQQWWKLFHSKDLDDLVETSLQHNPTVTAAQESLSAALENAYAGKGALFPVIGGSFAPTYQQTAKLLTSILANNQYLYSLFTGQLYISYTLDVFGGARRQLESLVAQAQMQQFQLQATYLTLTTNVVNAIISEAALREQITVTHDIVRNQKKLLALTQHQFNLGDAARSAIATQRTTLAAAESTLPSLEKQLAIARDLLNALTGRFPDDPQTPQFRFSSLQLPRELPLSVPSKLIENRPDIRAAEAKMQAANALVGVAVANRLPNFSISSSGTNLGSAAPNLGMFLQPDTQFWAMAGVLTQPIFDAGTLKHKHRAAKALYRQTAAEYRATVIHAFQDVADTLKSIRSDALVLHTTHDAVRAALASLDIARHQHALGDISSIDLLIKELVYQQARLNLIQAQANRLSDTVALFQALGGGWQTSAA